MKPADHINEILKAIHVLNKEGHVVQCDQFVTMCDAIDLAEKLKEDYYNLESAVHQLGKTLEWHSESKEKGTGLNTTSVGEVIEEED